ncbi:TetR/AcrR family transcriptional regulator [Actinomadura sp. DC4]|uniref:TetR/AcrR family transcriptional regulator n=1 Tax=Actinomadura sp. DC4 TaxID=3055069 RepID=UPI0025B1E1A5|nr:TetR/AcrR family transcriptional regulator [Actinomadura sp. DC4]MDN3359614.1 TetR/AcrR family transcriptional regulator [Actinomadura sp. DC4]
MGETTLDRASARERLLAAATELFYREGVRSVGIDRVIERAGVAKGSLYNTFGSKEALVRAYLEGRHTRTRERMARELAARYKTPRERLVGVFAVQGIAFAEPGFRGCAFVGASAQSEPGGAVEQVSEEYRVWVRSLFLDLAYAAEAPDPEGLARQLVMLYDGSGISAWMDHDPKAAETATTIATTLVDAAFAR